MARPGMTTPIEITVAVLRGMVAWGRAHAANLQTVFGSDFEPDERAESLAEGLESEHGAYVREKREDVGQTNRRQAVVKQTQRVVSSSLSLATIAFGDDDEFDDIRNDFSPIPPSHIRSIGAARKAMTQLFAAINIHGERMKQEVANFDDLEASMKEVAEELEEVSKTDALESAETDAARRKRQATRREAIDFIRDAQLAAEAVEFVQPEALEELHAVFDAHVPDHRRTTAEEDEIDARDDE